MNVSCLILLESVFTFPFFCLAHYIQLLYRFFIKKASTWMRDKRCSLHLIAGNIVKTEVGPYSLKKLTSNFYWINSWIFDFFSVQTLFASTSTAQHWFFLSHHLKAQWKEEKNMLNRWSGSERKSLQFLHPIK